MLLLTKHLSKSLLFFRIAQLPQKNYRSNQLQSSTAKEKEMTLSKSLWSHPLLKQISKLVPTFGFHQSQMMELEQCVGANKIYVEGPDMQFPVPIVLNSLLYYVHCL